MEQGHIKLRLAGMLTCLLFTLPVMPTDADESAVSDDINSIENIEIGRNGVEIHLKSSRPFPVRAIPPVLQIGSKSFDRSKRAEGGELNSLIFVLSSKDFSHLQPADPVRVIYGRGESPKQQWDFGVFGK